MPAVPQVELFYTGNKHEFDVSNWNHQASNSASTWNGDRAKLSSPSNLPKRQPETGIEVLIVGAGISGLLAALECWRKGHRVIGILERSETPVYTGDSIAVQPSGFAILRHWPDMTSDVEADQYDAGMTYKKHNGDHIYGPAPPSFNDPENMVGRRGPHVGFVQYRVKLYRMFLRQVAKVGLSVSYGAKVKDYFEDAAAGKGGVILESGQVYLADIVVAADGLKSSSAKILGGDTSAPRPSGMSIYRTAYPVGYAMSDLQVRERWQLKPGEPSNWEFYLGPGMHVAVFFSEDLCSWAITHRDNGHIEENWDPDVQPSEVLKVMEQVQGWHPALSALVQTAPPRSIVHWPLIWRDLRREWTSPGGRVVQIGDSAHSFLPSSGNGGTQALEDSVTLAACLQLAGKDNAALGTKVYELLRYERVSCAQKMAFVNAQIKQQTDWKAIEEQPSRIRSRFPKWVYQHDPEAYVYTKFGEAFAHLVSGEPFQNTNFPKGHKFVPWTIASITEDMKSGKSVEALLDGDWS